MADLDIFRPFDDGAGKTNNEAEWRTFARMMQASGVDFGYLNGFQVYADSTGRQVKVKTGRAWVDGHYGENTSEKPISLATNGSGNPRIDRIVLQLNPSTNTISIEVVQGTPAATPAAPALTQSPTATWQITLAQVAIANGYSTVAAGDVTDERMMYTNSPRMYTPPYCELTKSAAQTLSPATPAKITWNTENADTDGMHSPTSNTSRITIQRAGIYLVSASVRFTSNSFTDARAEILINNTTTVAAAILYNLTGTGVPRLSPCGLAKLAANDYLEVEVEQGSAGSRDVSASSKFAACYQGAYG